MTEQMKVLPYGKRPPPQPSPVRGGGRRRAEPGSGMAVTRFCFNGRMSGKLRRAGNAGMEGRTMDDERRRAADDWQSGLWDRMSDVYQREIDRRFAPVIEHVVARAGLRPGERALDLGTGTGAAAMRAAALVGPAGRVVGVDISPEMLALARRRVEDAGLDIVVFREGGAEAIPAENDVFDVVIASLSLMFVIDRAAAAREIARVLRPGGRLAVSAWAGPDRCDLIRFQQMAGSFAPPRRWPASVPALADAASFLAQLADAGSGPGSRPRRSASILTISSPPGMSSRTSPRPTSRRNAAGKAKEAVRAAMFPGGGPCHFRNDALFIIGERTM